MTAPVLSVVVLSWNTKDLTLACLRALFAEKPRHAREVIAVDNGSEDGSADAIAAAFPCGSCATPTAASTRRQQPGGALARGGCCAP